MRTLHVNSADTLLKSQETFVDFSTLYTPLPVVTLGVLSPLGASQIYQQELTKSLGTTCIFNRHTAYRMRSARCIICNCLVSSPDTMTEIDDIKHLLPGPCFLFFETLHLDALELVLQNLKLLLSVE